MKQAHFDKFISGVVQSGSFKSSFLKGIEAQAVKSYLVAGLYYPQIMMKFEIIEPVKVLFKFSGAHNTLRSILIFE